MNKNKCETSDNRIIPQSYWARKVVNIWLPDFLNEIQNSRTVWDVHAHRNPCRLYYFQRHFASLLRRTFHYLYTIKLSKSTSAFCCRKKPILVVVWCQEFLANIRHCRIKRGHICFLGTSHFPHPRAVSLKTHLHFHQTKKTRETTHGWKSGQMK